MSSQEKPKPVEDLTPEGVQYVMPGCEKDRSKGAKQMELF